ncbi:MAG: hypothetical protein WCG66_00790 [bacterium]
MPARILQIAGWLLITVPWVGQCSSEYLTPDQMSEASFLETVSIPTPGEFFLALDKQCQPNWSKLVRSSVSASPSDREHLALQLGILWTDGFMGIEAQDGQGVKNTARDILLLAKKLNVGQHILARSQSISDFADAGDWRRLREELNAMHNDIRLSLLEQKDSQLVVVALAGSWVRQMEIGSRLLSSGENPGATALLSQAELSSRILSSLENFPENSKRKAIIRQLMECLRTSTSLMSASPFFFSPSVLREMADCTAALTSAPDATDPKK